MATAPLPEPQGSEVTRVSTRNSVHFGARLDRAPDQDPPDRTGPEPSLRTRAVALGAHTERVTRSAPPPAASPPRGARTARPLTRATAPTFLGPTVPRTRVLRLLDEAATHPVVLVSGGPGSGKTVAVAEWTRQGGAPGPVCWVSVSAAESTPGRLATLIAEAATDALAEAGWRPGRDDRPDDLAAALESVARAQAVLVLDDLDLASDGPTLAVLEQVLWRPPAGLHLILIARAPRRCRCTASAPRASSPR